MSDITTDQLLAAYANGYFPMAINQHDPELYWFSPDERGVIPLDSFNIPRGLKRAMKAHDYTLTVDTAFEQVIRACGTVTPTRKETWINENIVALYTALFREGHAHSVEVWQRKSVGGELWVVGGEETESPRTTHHTPLTLIGGLYGISLGGAFFGESMFSLAPDASKIALVYLVKLLREAGYQLLDAQYVNEHLKQFGIIAMPKEDYMMKLEKALSASPNPSTRFSTASVRSGAASSSSLSLTSAS